MAVTAAASAAQGGSRKRKSGGKRAGDGAAKRRAAAAQPAGGATAYRGVTLHQRTKRFEAHVWLPSDATEAPAPAGGKQVYLGGFQTPEQAALAFDIAALRLRGADAQTNFDPRHYAGALAELAATPAADVFEALRRQGRGQGMQSSCYRGVSRHAKGRWEARLGSLGTGQRYVYCGLHKTEVAAAMAYDRRLIEVKGIEAETNFALSEYAHELSPEQLAAALQRGLMLPQELVVGSPCSLELLAAAAPGPTSSLGGGDGLGSPLPAWALQCDSHGSCGALPSASPAGSDLAGQLLSCILGSPLSVLPEPPRAVKAE